MNYRSLSTLKLRLEEAERALARRIKTRFAPQFYWDRRHPKLTRKQREELADKRIESARARVEMLKRELESHVPKTRKIKSPNVVNFITMGGNTYGCLKVLRRVSVGEYPISRPTRAHWLCECSVTGGLIVKSGQFLRGRTDDEKCKYCRYRKDRHDP